MSTDFDINALLEPIAEELPVGTDLRDDADPTNIYRQIRDAREEARQAERQADLDGEESAEAMRHWREVSQKSYEYLSGQAKDLEISAYLIEAQVRLNGFFGLADTLRLTRGLILNYWGELYPTPDEDGIETTLLPIARLNGDVISNAVGRIKATDGSSEGPFAFWQYRQALELDQYGVEEREERINRGAISTDMVNRSVAESQPEFFRELYDSIVDAESALQELIATLDERAEADSPNLSRVTESISDSLSAVRLIAGDKLILEEETVEDEYDDVGDDGSGAPSGGGGGPIRNRDDAFRILLEVADWFEKTEPQSILPPEIRKAVRRGRMSPTELYMDLINDETVRGQLFRDVGISDPESHSDGYSEEEY